MLVAFSQHCKRYAKCFVFAYELVQTDSGSKLSHIIISDSNVKGLSPDVKIISVKKSHIIMQAHTRPHKHTHTSHPRTHAHLQNHIPTHPPPPTHTHIHKQPRTYTYAHPNTITYTRTHTHTHTYSHTHRTHSIAFDNRLSIW